MNDKFSIDDSIILDPRSSKTNNIKKVLTGIAILVVLFLIVLIIMKFINSGDTPEPTPLVMPSEEIIFKPKESKDEAPKVVATEPAKEPKPVQMQPIEIKDQTTPVVETTSASKETVKPRQEVVVVTSKKDEETARNDDVAKKAAEEAAKLAEAKKLEDEKLAKATEAKKTEAEKIAKVAEAKKAEELKKANEAKKLAEEAAKKATTKPGTLLTGDIPSGNYIQVLATSEFNADADYIKKLTSKGYDYRLHKTIIDGKEFTKVLVGPFGGNMQQEMANIRASVNKDAFVFRVQ